MTIYNFIKDNSSLLVNSFLFIFTLSEYLICLKYISYHYNYTDYIVKNISLDNYKLLERKHIIDFLKLNNIYL